MAANTWPTNPTGGTTLPAADLHRDPCFDAPFGLATALHLAKTPFCNNALGHGLDDRVPAAGAQEKSRYRSVGLSVCRSVGRSAAAAAAVSEVPADSETGPIRSATVR